MDRVLRLASLFARRLCLTFGYGGGRHPGSKPL
jgi:hypothetical protein